MSAPERTCVGCRSAAEADDLVRLVVSPEGAVVADLKGRLPGRGAWVHVSRPCLVAARTQWARALREPVDAAGVEAVVMAAVGRALADGISLATAGGALQLGRAAVEEWVRFGKAREILLSVDAAERTARQVEAVAMGATPAVVCTRIPLTSDALGQLTGRGAVAVLAVSDAPAGRHLRRQLRRVHRLALEGPATEGVVDDGA